MPIAGSYRIHRHTLRSAHFVASRLSPSHRYRCTRSSSRSSPRLAGRIVVSLCRLSIQSHIRCGFDCLLTAAGSVVVVSSRRAVPSCVSCLLAPRLAFAVLSHRSSPRSPSPRSSTRLAGREAGSAALSSCLISVMRSVPMSIAGLYRFLCGVSSVCLPVGSAAGERCSHLVVRDVLRCPACPSARLVSRHVSRHDGRGVGRLRCGCGVLSFPVLISLPAPACLLRVVSRHPSDTDGGGSLRFVGSVCGLLACLSRCIRAVSIVSSLCLSLSWVVRLARFCAVP